MFSKVISACRAHFNVGEDQSLRLEFDGERLEPYQEVQSTDLSDKDRIDVYILDG